MTEEESGRKRRMRDGRNEDFINKELKMRITNARKK